MSKRSYNDVVVIETIVDLCDALVKVTDDMMSLHGKDPDSFAIICSGYLMAIKEIAKSNPVVVPVMQQMILEMGSDDVRH